MGKRRTPVFVVETIKSGDGVQTRLEFASKVEAYQHILATYGFSDGEIDQLKRLGYVELNYTQDGADLVGIKREDRLVSHG